jgi:hypothetical protein
VDKTAARVRVFSYILVRILPDTFFFFLAASGEREIWVFGRGVDSLNSKRDIFIRGLI